MPAGGPRPGSGRKSAAEEFESRSKAVAAIEAQYGSLEEGLKKLLQSGEPALIKFVYEHAFGKPKESVDLSSMGKAIKTINWVFPKDE